MTPRAVYSLRPCDTSTGRHCAIAHTKPANSRATAVTATCGRLFLTAVLTGMRRGELFGLQWGDIDWNQGRIHVQRSIYWRPRKDTNPGEPCWTFVTPKSSYSRRTIVMSPRLKEALEIHKMACPRSEHDLVFSTRKGTPLDAVSVFYNEFLPALARAGLRRIRFHDLRHTFTTLLIHQGENIKFVQGQLGHASAMTTLDRYGHLMPNAQQEAGRRLDGQVFGSGALPLAGSPEQEVSLARP